jgi:F-type H+-transporting ATPase subunit b
MPLPPGHGAINPHALPPPGAHAPQAGDGHGAPGHGAPGHGDGHGEGEHALGPINWFSGLLGEKDGVEPDLLTRKTGMPVPFLANIINLSVLLYLGFRFGKKPLEEGLKKRKTDLMRDIDEAAKVKAEAEARLGEYEGKLKKIDDELARIKKEYAEQGERDKERIVRDAKEKRARMKRDAELLVEQEGKALEKSLVEQTVARATALAEDLVKQKLASSDHERLADEYLRDVAKVQAGGLS